MRQRVSLLCLFVLFLTACQPTIPPDALMLSPESLANRQMQTRRFETTNSQAMLSAAAAVMQDLGFTLDESETTLGILVGSKRRDATSGGQVVGAILFALLGSPPPPVDKEQLIRVSMVMREITPSGSAATDPAKKGESSVRVTFQRVITNTANQVTLAEQINELEVYKDFFDKLSQSVFLEAHEL